MSDFYSLTFFCLRQKRYIANPLAYFHTDNPPIPSFDKEGFCLYSFYTFLVAQRCDVLQVFLSCVCVLEYTSKKVNLLTLSGFQFNEECRILYTAVAQRWAVVECCVVLRLRFWRKCKPVWIFKVYVWDFLIKKRCFFFANCRCAEMKGVA